MNVNGFGDRTSFEAPSQHLLGVTKEKQENLKSG
jgi:hypothetical protein